MEKKKKKIMVSRSQYDFIIIGGGFSGLYCLYRLVKQYGVSKTYLLIEKKGRLGGRIKSIRHSTTVMYDAGAVRLSEFHTRTLSFIKDELQLPLVSLPIVPDQSSKSILLQELYDEYHNHDQLLKETSIHTLFSLKYPDRQWSDMVPESSMYQTTVRYKNAYDFFLNMHHNYNATQYYSVKDGLEEIIFRLEEWFRIFKQQNPSCCLEIQLKTMCRSWRIQEKTSCTLSIKTFGHAVEQLIRGNTVFVCIPPRHLPFSTMSSIIGSINYIRIYGELLSTTTATPTIPCSWVGPMLPTPIPSLYQLSYRDGDLAYRWYEYLKSNRADQFIRETYPRMKWYNCHYWKHGTHYWKIGFTSKDYLPRLLELKPKQLYLGGEAFSTNQGWIEGCMESIHEMLRLFFHPPPLCFINQTSFDRFYTMADVVQSRYVVYHEDVYDISSILKQHPGGKVIEMGLGTDITFLFHSIEHTPRALRWLQECRLGKLLK